MGIVVFFKKWDDLEFKGKKYVYYNFISIREIILFLQWRKFQNIVREIKYNCSKLKFILQIWGKTQIGKGKFACPNLV